MSLRAFHILFILIASTTIIGFAAWCFILGGSDAVVMGSIAALSGPLLIAYGIVFLKKNIAAAQVELR